MSKSRGKKFKGNASEASTLVVYRPGSAEMFDRARQVLLENGEHDAAALLTDCEEYLAHEMSLEELSCALVDRAQALDDRPPAAACGTAVDAWEFELVHTSPPHFGRKDALDRADLLESEALIAPPHDVGDHQESAGMDWNSPQVMNPNRGMSATAALSYQGALDPEALEISIAFIESVRAGEPQPVWEGSLDNREDRKHLIYCSCRQVLATMNQVPSLTSWKHIKHFIDGVIDLDAMHARIRRGLRN